MNTPIYIDTYFRVESGYDGGRMPEEKGPDASSTR